MPLPHSLSVVRDRLGMYLLKSDFNSTVAFLQGFDAAMCGGLLFGFREWLVVQHDDDGDNLAWPLLARSLMERSSSAASVAVSLPRQDDGTFLFQLLDEFFSAKDQPGGLAEIFQKHRQWLQSRLASE